jgi:hypothetical protein
MCLRELRWILRRTTTLSSHHVVLVHELDRINRVPSIISLAVASVPFTSHALGSVDDIVRRATYLRIHRLSPALIAEHGEDYQCYDDQDDGTGNAAYDGGVVWTAGVGFGIS